MDNSDKTRFLGFCLHLEPSSCCGYSLCCLATSDLLDQITSAKRSMRTKENSGRWEDKDGRRKWRKEARGGREYEEEGSPRRKEVRGEENVNEDYKYQVIKRYTLSLPLDRLQKRSSKQLQVSIAPNDSAFSSQRLRFESQACHVT